MKCILLTPWISPHQLPLAEEVVKLIGGDNFLYFYLEPPPPNHVLWGWDKLGKEKWCKLGRIDDKLLLDCDLLLSGVRDVSIFEERARRGKQTWYMSERWFKPPIGMLRLLHPKYLLMAWRLVKFMRSEPSFTYLPIGIHAARDMARLCGLFAGDLRCLFRAPELEFERKPGGMIYLRKQGTGNREQDKKYCLNKMRMWGYFVEPSKYATPHPQPVNHNSQLKAIKVLWVGRFLDWKRVDTLIKACKCLENVELDLYGSGPEEQNLKKLAEGVKSRIRFHSPVHTDEVRNLMRTHDAYVLSSNGYEGWGAVVSEALEEGMKVIGTYEAGSAGTILPHANLFHSGDSAALMHLLRNDISSVDANKWSAASGAKTLVSVLKK